MNFPIEFCSVRFIYRLSVLSPTTAAISMACTFLITLHFSQPNGTLARSLARLIDQYEAALPRGGWPNWVLGNHDRPRLATRVGVDQARVAAMLLMTLRGTPTLYYGDEIGMQQAAILPEQVQDPFE